MNSQEARTAIDHYVGALAVEKRRADDAESELASLRIDRAELADEVHALRERIVRMPDRLHDAEAERDAAVAKLDQIRDLHCVVTVHSIDDQGSITHVRECLACFVPYPCATVRILDGEAQS